MEGSTVSQPIEQAVPRNEQAPVNTRGSKVLRPLSRALGAAALTVAALGPGKSEAMDLNVKKILVGAGATVLNKETGIVLQPGPNGEIGVDWGASMRNRQAKKQEQAMQLSMMELQAAFNKPTNFNIQPAIAQLHEMGGVAVVTDNTLYLYHVDKVNTPEFLNSQFRISSSGTVKNVTVSLRPVHGGFIMVRTFIQVLGQQSQGQQGQTQQVIKATEEIMIALDPRTKTFIAR